MLIGMTDPFPDVWVQVDDTTQSIWQAFTFSSRHSVETCRDDLSC